MARWAKTAALLLGIVLLAPSNDQVITRGYVYSNIGTTYAWSGSAQAWSGSVVAVSCTDWTTYIKNDGTACTPGPQTVLYSYSTAHAVVSVSHSPLLVNNTFYGGNLSGWTPTSTGSCAGYTWSAQNATDQDGDNGYAVASSGTCTTGTVLKLAQTFTVGTSPTNQTYSFYYQAPVAVYGNPNCTRGTGSGTLSMIVNGSTVVSPTLNFDGKWHQVVGTMSAMVSGSNTLTFSATLQAASGQNGVFNKNLQDYTCYPTHTVAQGLLLDDISLSAVY